MDTIIKMDEKETGILNYVFAAMDIKAFNVYINNYNIAGMYERRKNSLVNQFFDGNVLQYSVTLRAIFNQFQTTKQELQAKELYSKMHFLAQEIRNKKKYKQPHLIQVVEYNAMADLHNELNKGIVILSQLYNTLISIKKAK